LLVLGTPAAYLVRVVAGRASMVIGVVLPASEEVLDRANRLMSQPSKRVVTTTAVAAAGGRK